VGWPGDVGGGLEGGGGGAGGFCAKATGARNAIVNANCKEMRARWLID